MNDLQVFKYQDSEVRTIEMNGEPWFVLKDVCKVLAMDVTQLKKTTDRLDADEKGRTQITTPVVYRKLGSSTNQVCTMSSCAVTSLKQSPSANGSHLKSFLPFVSMGHT